MNNRILYKKLEREERYDKRTYRKIQILNIKVPPDVSIYLYDGKHKRPSAFVFPTMMYPDCSCRLGIMINKNDLNLQVLLHEIGHYLDWKIRNSFGNSGEIDERLADIKGTSYYKKISGNDIRVNIYETGCGKPNSREVKVGRL